MKKKNFIKNTIREVVDTDEEENEYLRIKKLAREMRK